MPSRSFVVGAGLSGLSCAVRLAARGRRVDLLESANHAGGRCRSYVDGDLGCRIDNGNHLLLSGNNEAFAYLSEIGATETLEGPSPASFRFVDVASGEAWTVRPNGGRFPWWIFSSSRRVAGTRAREYLGGLRLARAGASRTVAEVLDDGGPLYRRFWEPFALAVMNTKPDEASAALLWPVVRETLGRGEAAYRPRIARDGLSETYVDPALAFLAKHGATTAFGRRVRELVFDGGRVCAIDVGGERIAIDEGDCVVLAVPPGACASLVPGLTVPEEFRAIVNVHFRLPDAGAAGGLSVVGLVGGLAQWLFRRGCIASVTISAADDVVDSPSEEIAARVWHDISQVLGRPGTDMPPYRIVKEKRATFAQTPAQIARRPGPRTPWRNLVLAGDWTDTGIPATIEGAIRSGRRAAETILSQCEGS